MIVYSSKFLQTGLIIGLTDDKKHINFEIQTFHNCNHVDFDYDDISEIIKSLQFLQKELEL